jgi:hypothetical protein
MPTPNLRRAQPIVEAYCKEIGVRTTGRRAVMAPQYAVLIYANDSAHAPEATEAEPKCDPNYRRECVPIDSDVDCGGGSGNGPSYVYGVVKVIGIDIYELDRDDDGYGCD